MADQGNGTELERFLVGRLLDAPAVYDPGGRTCMVDDFAWRSPDAADELLAAART